MMMLVCALLVRFASCGTYYKLQTPTELHTGWHNGYGACRPNIKPKETECVSEVMTNVIKPLSSCYVMHADAQQIVADDFCNEHNYATDRTTTKQTCYISMYISKKVYS